MIYLDNAATTRPAREAVMAMLPYLTEVYGNASAAYNIGAVSRRAVDRARDAAGRLIGASSDEIYFTSGGSESDNWALTAAYEASGNPEAHIITTAIEHPAVLRCAEHLASRGAKVTYLMPDADGIVSPAAVRNAIRKDTCLISVMTANNETGTIEPVREIGEIARERGILFHTDAVQAAGHIPIDVKNDNIDLLSASAHKLYGPKGCGMLFIRRGIRIGSFIRGGAQERGRRAGTENVAGIVGFGKAAELAGAHMELRARRERHLRDMAFDEIARLIPDAQINGHLEKRLPGNISVTVPGTDGALLVAYMDRKGIAISSGSACAAGSMQASHVMMALGRTEEEARGTVRLTLSYQNTEEEIRTAVRELAEGVRVCLL